MISHSPGFLSLRDDASVTSPTGMTFCYLLGPRIRAYHPPEQDNDITINRLNIQKPIIK